MSASATGDWSAARERSNLLALRSIAWIAAHLGRPAARWVLHPITLYFLAFAPAARRHSRRYLARALGRAPGWAERYRHLHAFAAVALDRLWFASGRLEVFELAFSGQQAVEACVAEGRGAILLGAHLGSFEALHAVGQRLRGLRVAMVMYPRNARKIHAVLNAIAPGYELGIIPIGERRSTLAIRDWLDGGGLAGVLGDRHLGGDEGRASLVSLPFLGRPADFSDGPMRLALLLKRRVIFMVGLYRGGCRYEVRFEELADFRQPGADPAERERLVQAGLRRYVHCLEALCREAPLNWFNFHDFWREDGPQDATAGSEADRDAQRPA